MIKKICDRCFNNYDFQKVYIYDLCPQCFTEYKELLNKFVHNTNHTTKVNPNEQEKVSNT